MDVKPMIALMHDYANVKPSPAWGAIGSWQYWWWSQLYPDPRTVIEPYLTEAARLGKPVALSIMLLEDFGRDGTPPAVYAQIGASSTIVKNTDPTKPNAAVPAYGNPKWEQAYFDFVRLCASYYDGDPRINSWWICTGLYGETVEAKSGYNFGGQYFRKFVQRSVVEFSAAFVKTPCFLLGTGTTDRRAFADLCAVLGVGFKMNALQPDPRNAVFPKNGGGLADCALAVMDSIPVGYEHAFAANEAQTYWAMLTGLAFGMKVLDLPAPYLDILAAMKHPSGERMWDWVLRMMDGGAFWIARQTAYPTGDWERGYVGAYAREMTLTSGAVTLFGPGAILPDDLRGYVSAYGFGMLSGEVTFTHGLVARRYHVWAVVSSGVSLGYAGQTIRAETAGWNYIGIEDDGAEITLSGEGYVHAVGVDVFEGVPEEPPVEPPVGDYGAEVALLKSAIESLAESILDKDAKIKSLQTEITVQDAEIGDLKIEVGMLMETWRKVKEALA